MKILTKITNVTRRFKSLRIKKSTRKINNIISKSSLPKKLRTARFLTRSNNQYHRISTLSSDLLCYNLFSSRLCRYYSDVSKDKGLDGNDSTKNYSDKKVIVSFPSKFEPQMLNYVKIPWMQSSDENFIVGAVMPQNDSKENDTKKLCQFMLNNNITAEDLERVKVSLVPVYYGECNARIVDNVDTAETFEPPCQRDKNYKLSQYFNSKINKMSISSMMVDVEFKNPKISKVQTPLDAATPLTFKTVTDGEIRLSKKKLSKNMDNDQINIESLISAVVSQITSAAIKKAHEQTKLTLKSREEIQRTIPVYATTKKIPLRQVPNLAMTDSIKDKNKALDNVKKTKNAIEPIKSLPAAYNLGTTQQPHALKNEIPPTGTFIASINQIKYKKPVTKSSALIPLPAPKKTGPIEAPEIPMSSVFLDCFAIFKKKGKPTLVKSFKHQQAAIPSPTRFVDDKKVQNVKSDLNINLGVMAGSTLEPPIKQIVVAKTQERKASTCKGSGGKGSGKSPCGSGKKAAEKKSSKSICGGKAPDKKSSKSSVCGKGGGDKKGGACPPRPKPNKGKGSKSSVCSKGAEKKGSKSSVCGGGKKGAGKKSVCGGGKAADKKGSKTSICGKKGESGKKSAKSICGGGGGDKKSSKTSICGSSKKGGDKKSSVCGAGKKGGDRKSVCGSAKGPDKKGSKTSICGAGKGGDKKASKSSICGSSKKADKKGSKSSICGSAKKGGDKKSCGAAKKSGSKTSICGAAKKDSKASGCGSGKKGGADKKGGSSKKGSDKKKGCGTGSKKSSKTSVCATSKGADKKPPTCLKEPKKTVCGSSKRKNDKMGAKCGKSGDKKGSKSSICGSKKSKNTKPGSTVMDNVLIIRPPPPSNEVNKQIDITNNQLLDKCSSESGNILIDLNQGMKLKIDNIDVEKVKFNERAEKECLSDKTSMIITIRLPKNLPNQFKKSPGISISKDPNMKDEKKFSTLSNNCLIEKNFIDDNLNKIIVRIIKDESTD